MSKKEIMDQLHNIHRCGYSMGDIFRDWLELMVTANLRDDESYLKVMGRYEQHNKKREHGKRPADYFANAYGELIKAMQNKYEDYLGELYQEHISFGENGQFFTPEELCKTLADMTCHNLQPGQKVCDPACGSGRTLLAATRICDKAMFYGIDVDLRCCHIAVLNMLHRNVDCIIIHGNSLTLEYRGGWIMNKTINGATIRKASDELGMSILGATQKDSTANHAMKKQQVQLGFGL